MSLSKPNTLFLLECLANAREPLAFAEIRRRTGLTPATLTRLLNRLVEHQYVHKVAHGEYEAGQALVVLGAQATENAAAVPYRPLLRDIAQRTRMNAELYALHAAGPVFLLAMRGHSTARIGIAQGQIVDNVYRHPAGRFFFIRWPQAFNWRANQMKHCGIDPGRLQLTCDDALVDRFAIDRGSISPTLARACVPTRDPSFCVGVSCPIDELPSSREPWLRRTMHEALEAFYSELVRT